MAIPLMNIEDSDLLLSLRQVGEKYHRDHIGPFLKLWFHSTHESSSSSNIEKLKSLIESSPSYGEEIRSEDTSSQHNMDEDYGDGDDSEDDCYGVFPPIRQKK
ncbi:unnamed protein product [Malus baccata var. baccata]